MRSPMLVRKRFAQGFLNCAIVFTLVVAAIVGGCTPTPLGDLNSHIIPYEGELKHVSVAEVKFAYPTGIVREAPGGAGGVVAGTSVAPVAGMTVGGAFAGAGTALGTMIELERAEIDSKIVNKRFKELSMDQNIAESLRASLVGHLRNSSFIVPAQQGSPNVQAKLLAVITGYGFGSPNSLTFRRKPVLSVQAVLITNPPFEINWQTNEKRRLCGLQIVDPEQHHLIWQKVVWVNPFWRLPSHTLAEYLDDPKMTKEAFKVACDKVVERLISDLKETFE